MDQNQELQKLQLEQLKKVLLGKLLTKEAKARLGNVRTAHPDLAEQVELGLIQAAQQGQLRQIDDTQLKMLLKNIHEGKKVDFKIL